MNQGCEVGFGPHLTLDLCSCNRERLSDITFIYKLLDELPELIGMHKIAPPQVIYYPGKEGSFDKGGISAFVLIAESHITIHTFIEQEHAFVDIFSCKTFDIEKAEKHLVEKLESKNYQRKLFDRGLEFPREIPVVKNIVRKERKSLVR